LAEVKLISMELNFVVDYGELGFSQTFASKVQDLKSDVEFNFHTILYLFSHQSMELLFVVIYTKTYVFIRN
jgi:hypothetical protein